MAGVALFLFDPPPYQATLDVPQAQVARALAAAPQAQATLVARALAVCRAI